jgi:hypothetical protein
MLSNQFIPLLDDERVFVSSRHIKRKTLVAVWLQKVVDDTWVNANIDDYQLVNNAVVFDDDLLASEYKQVELRVGDNESDLGENPSDISILAGIEADIQTVADNADSVSTVADNIGSILTATDAADTASAAALAAEVYKDQASASASNASASETNAQGFAISASSSATNASTSETNAATSEANALASANEAEVFRDNTQAIADSIGSAATAINMADAGDYWDSTNLEDFTQEVGQQFQSLRTATPTLSGNTSAPEGSQLVVTITNYSATATYTVNVESGSYVRTGDTITWTLPAFTGVDDVHNLTVEAQENGDLPSELATLTVTVTDIESDQTILYEGGTITATQFPTVTDVDLSGNTLLATSDSATATSLKVEQDGGDTDFVSAVPTVDSKAVVYDVYTGGEDNTSTTNLIPTMTSNTAPSGIAFASTYYTSNDSYNAYRAMNGNDDQTWISQTTTGYIGFIDTVAKAVDKYGVQSAGSANNGTNACPRDWQLQGSNDTTDGTDGTWTDIGNPVSGITYSGQKEMKYFTVTNSTEYSAYRINITSNNGNSGVVEIGRFELIESQYEYSNTSVTVSGQTLADTILINDGASTDLIEFDTAGNVSGYEYLVDSIDPFGDSSLLYKLKMEDATATVGTDPINNGVTFTSDNSGFYGNCGIFERVNSDWINCGAITPTQFTFSLYAKCNDVSLNASSVLAIGDGTNTSFAFTVGFQINTIRIYDLATATNVVHPTTPVNNTWYHFAATYDGSQLELYVDGVPSGSPTTTTLTNLNQTIRLGHAWFTSYHSGNIDQFELYNRALTPVEIDVLYNQGGLYTLDLTSASLTNAPTIVAKDVPTISTSLVATGGADSFVERTLVSATADNVGGIVANDEFETVLWTGDATARTISTPNITNGVDFVWTKTRDIVGFHRLFDNIRGAGELLYTNDTSSEVTEATSLTAFNNDGFNLGTLASVNNTGTDYVAWCASLPNHTPVNTDGTITSETKANSFMSVVGYVGSTSDGTIGHGLSKEPEFIIAKDRENGVKNWQVWHKDLTSLDYYLNLDTADGESNSLVQPFLSVSDTTIGLNSGGWASGAVENHIAYCFTSKEGVSKVGSYSGTGASGNAVDCGFEPQWVMIKRADGIASWEIVDNLRGQGELKADSSSAEGSFLSSEFEGFSSNGFSVGSTIASLNASGGTYIYLAIAKNIDQTPTEITTLFDADTRSGRDFKVQVDMDNGEEVSRISVPISKLG